MQYWDPFNHRNNEILPWWATSTNVWHQWSPPWQSCFTRLRGARFHQADQQITPTNNREVMSFTYGYLMSRVHSEQGLLRNLEHFVQSRGAGIVGVQTVLAVPGWLLRWSYQGYIQSYTISSMHPRGLIDACNGRHRCGEDVHERGLSFPKFPDPYYTLTAHSTQPK